MFQLFGKTFAPCQQFQILSSSISAHSKHIRFESTNRAEIRKEDTCRLEVEQWHSRNQSCLHPDTFTSEDWNNLIAINSKSQRRKYCRWLYLKAEKTRLQLEEKIKKQNESRMKLDIMLEDRKNNKHIAYGLGANCLFMRYRQKQFNLWGNLRMACARQYGVKVLVDCSFEDTMTVFEQTKVVTGMRKTFVHNRLARHPLHLQLCGLKPDSYIMDLFKEALPSIDKSHISQYSQCYSDLYPRERLVVLTPDSPNTIEYDNRDIYVVSGIVDFARADPISFDKATQLGVRTAKLPMHLIQLAPGRSIEMPFFNVVNCIRARSTHNDWMEIVEKYTPLEIQQRYDCLNEEDRQKLKDDRSKITPLNPEIIINDYANE